MASINEFARLLGLKPELTAALLGNQTYSAAESGSERGVGDLGENSLRLIYSHHALAQPSDNGVHFSETSTMAPESLYLYNRPREHSLFRPYMAKSTFPPQRHMTSLLDSTMVSTGSSPSHASGERLSESSRHFKSAAVSFNRIELAKGDINKCNIDHVSSHAVSSHGYRHSEHDPFLKKFSQVLFAKTQQACTISTDDPDSLYKDVIVTSVFASVRHPLYGYRLDITDVQVIYDSRGFIQVIQTPYIEKGIYQVMSNGPKTKHPDFPGHFKEQTRFIRCESIVKSEPDLHYVILKDIIHVQSSVSQHRDLSATQYREFINSTHFLTYTLPVILGCGHDDTWSSMFGQVVETRPVCLKGEQCYSQWKFFEKHMPTASCQSDSGTASFRQYMNQRFEVWDNITSESECLRLKHMAFCYGCAECMDREQYIACIKQRPSSLVSPYSRKRRTRFKSATRKVGSRKRRFSRSKSSAARRNCNAVLRKKSTKKMKLILGIGTEKQNAEKAGPRNEALDNSMASEQRSSSTSSSAPTSAGSNSSSDSSPSSPEESGKTRRNRKRKLVCDCPGCQSCNEIPTKSFHSGDVTTNDCVTETFQRNRSN